MQNSKAFLSSLTHHPGIYQMLGASGEVLYVGKAKNLKKRILNYFKANQLDPKTRVLMQQVKDISVIVTHSENEALLLESNLIKKLQPRYNVLLRDDKSYPYIVLTMEHDFPRIDIHRGPKKSKGEYFGPYPSATAARETIYLIQRIFRIRSCKDSFYNNRSRPCLQFQINRCTGPCVGMVGKVDYQEDIRHVRMFLTGKSPEIIDELVRQMEVASNNLNYELAARRRDQIAMLRQIQERQYVSSAKGDADVIAYVAAQHVVCIQLLSIRDGMVLGSRSYFPKIPLAFTPAEVVSAFISQHYLSETKSDMPKEILVNTAVPERNWLSAALAEKAGHKIILAQVTRGEKRKWLDITVASARQALASRIVMHVNYEERFQELEKILKMNKPIQRIECFDVSHSSGEATVASCVVFNRNGALKSDYRRFNISGITGGDDFAALHQALHRRYKRVQAEEARMPDVLLIDGGKGQLTQAKQVLQELDIQGISLIGVAKGVTRKPGYETLHLSDGEQFTLEPDSSALHLIQQVRDEAHRFAITGHRLRRDKKRQTSTLESIPGIGAKRRRELLRHFGGIQAINRASLDELAKAPGISKSLAKRLYDALHHL